MKQRTYLHIIEAWYIIEVMAKRKRTFTDQIRDAVDASDMSRYRICKEIDIAESTMSRFMAGGWLGKENIDTLAELLRLEVKTTRKSSTPKGR